jgi:hypothetical protein
MSAIHVLTSSRYRRIATCAAIAVLGVLVFHAVSVASGKLEESGGLGWDGRAYARMVTVALTDGSSNTQTRPLLPLLTRIPYALGLDVVASYQLLNYLYAFLLYLSAALILDTYKAPIAVTCVVVLNLGLCVATSKMFGFYPTQIDLGALALTTAAFYFAGTERRRLAGGACVLAAASREFGFAAALYGIHRSIRLKRPIAETALVFLPSLLVTVLIRVWVVSTVEGPGPLSAADALENLRKWLSPAFVAAFLYFAVALFGGVSTLLVVRPLWCLRRLRDEPELATFLLVFLGLTAVGSLDIWRYLAFSLPVALVLIARSCSGCSPDLTRRLLVAMTLITLVTQRPFQAMDTNTYFRDWFPLYRYFDGQVDGMAPLWAARVAALVLLTAALALTTHRSWGLKRVNA